MTSPRVIEGDGDGANARVAIVASLYNRHIVDRLLSGCLRTLRQRGVRDDRIAVVRVPGAFEIPLTVMRLARAGDADAVIALGAVIRGETSHFGFIAAECARGVAQVALETGVPAIFGVLTVDSNDQAMDRSGDEESNKGCEAARSALDMIHILAKVGK